jgi:hypothetical protein
VIVSTGIALCTAILLKRRTKCPILTITRTWVLSMSKLQQVESNFCTFLTGIWLSKADVFCMIAQIPFWVLLTENPPLLFQKSLHDNPHALDIQHFGLQNTSNKSYIYHSHQKLLDLYKTSLLTIWTVCTLTNITSNVPEIWLLVWGGGCNVEKCTPFFSSHASKHKPMSLIQHSSASLLKTIP